MGNSIRANFAKRSLDLGGEVPANYNNGIDTLACKIDGRTSEEFEQLMGECPGFVALQLKGKVGFVKFVNPAAAAAALESAVSFGIAADFAKRNLGTNAAIS